MNQTLVSGIGVITLAGILQGSFAAPMKWGVGCTLCWPIFMMIIIIAALCLALLRANGTPATRRALVYNWTGVGILLLAIGIISAGNAA